MNELIYPVPNRIENNISGFGYFAKAYSELHKITDTKITFDFSKTTWFEANLSAVFSSLIEVLRLNGCIVEAIGINDSLQQIFMKNGFFARYNLGEIEDTYDSTIPFRVFDVDDVEGFTEYLNESVIPKINLPLTTNQIRFFKKCLQEVFVNAGMHADSQCVYTCGQYYHAKQKVAFTIVDVGKTIGQNVRRKIPEVIDCDAIEWATQFGHTTKVEKDGGIGLHFLKEYLEANGILHIISGNGYWEQDRRDLFYRNTKYRFGGTIVNLVSDLSGEIKSRVGKIEF